jgi:hypothetical protein
VRALFTQGLNTAIPLDAATVNLCPGPIHTAILHNYIARSYRKCLALHLMLWIKLPGFSHFITKLNDFKHLVTILKVTEPSRCTSTVLSKTNRDGNADSGNGLNLQTEVW